MSEQYDRDELRRAQQLAEQLDGKPVPDAEPEAADLARFASSLPWPPTQPQPTFRAGLRGKLQRLAASRPQTRPAKPPRRTPRVGWSLSISWGGLVLIILLIAVVTISVLALLGPRIREIFGSVYNSLEGSGVYEHYDYTPPAATAAAQYVLAPTAAVVATPGPVVSPVTGDANVPPPPAPAARKIIKNAELSLQVKDTDAAVARLSDIATQSGGYIISTNMWTYDDYKQAAVIFAVPAEQLEPVLEQIRETATRVERESVTGQDVTEEYIDLDSRMRNLEATQARLRTLLDKAATVEEAVDVSRELSSVEEQIEVIKGRMQYLEVRSAYSTISVQLTPPRAVPKPGEWKPGDTFQQARKDLVSVLHSVGDALIWTAVVLLPLVGIPALVIVGVIWAVRRLRRRRKAQPGV